MRIPKYLGPVLITALLAACGGGGGGGGGDDDTDDGPPAANVAANHTGTWTNCAAFDESSSTQLRVTITATGASTATFVAELLEYPALACAGSGTVVGTQSGVIDFTGTRQVNGVDVNLLERTVTVDDDATTSEPRVEKDISRITSDSLVFGDDDTATDDSGGFPTALEDLILTRDNSPSDAVVASHVGDWGLCVVFSDNTSLLSTLALSRSGADELTYQEELSDYATPDCSGAVIGQSTESGRLALVGTRTIGGQTVNLVEKTVTADSDNSTVEPRTEKDLSRVSGDQLFLGDDSTGADGYPTELESDLFFDRL